MYGKIFESMFQGSMVGSGSATFAVWAYVIANMRRDGSVGAQVDLNPKLLAFVLGEKEAVVEGVIRRLCQPDEKSTSKAEGGRRLVRLGEFAFRVVNGAHYMDIRTGEERREYNRIAKAKQRASKKVKTRDQVRAENEGRERRFVEAEGRGDEQGADDIAAEGLQPEPFET